MEMIKKIIAFLDEIKKVDDINLDVSGEDTIRILLEKSSNNETFIKKFIDSASKNNDLEIKEEDAYVIFLTTLRCQWTRSEKSSGEGYLDGGFTFKGLGEIYLKDQKFWEKEIKKISKLDNITLNNKLIESLKVIESQFLFLNLDAIQLPYAGCVVLEENRKLPKKFYYFDGGIVFKLNLFSFDDYINALIYTAGVKGWQYFYINPNDLIDLNNKTNYFSWTIKTSNIDERINNLTYHEDIQIDRLNLLIEYLERCVNILPKTFNFLDFSHHKNHLNELKKLHSKIRGND